MSNILHRQASKRKRDENHDISPSKRYAQIAQVKSSCHAPHAQSEDSTTANLKETRRLLQNLFNAIETTLLSTRSICSFHSIKVDVEATARCNFELPHLAHILGVWPEVYTIEPAMVLIRDARVPSLAIIQTADTGTPAQRRQVFISKLDTWHGQTATLPDIAEQTLLPLNAAKIASIAKIKFPSMAPVESAAATTSAKDRQLALAERIRTKALLKANEPTPEELKSATIAALIPAAVTSIKMMLASRRIKSIGMVELCDNLGTSLSNRLGVAELRQLVEQMSRHPTYEKWCKIATVGNVRVVRFVGAVPRALVA